MPALRDQPRVLIVEDDAVTALMLSTLMAEMGVEVIGLASTGPRGVALADYHRPDLALVDVNLAKGTDGMKAARQMRRELKLPVVLVSGTEPSDRTDWEGEELPLIRKPFDSGQIKSAVRRLLGQRMAEAVAVS